MDVQACSLPPTSVPIRHGERRLACAAGGKRCVLFAACTRARDHLHVSGTGEPSPFLPPGTVEPIPPPPLTRPADPFGLLADDGEHSRVAWCRRDGGEHLVQCLGHHR